MKVLLVQASLLWLAIVAEQSRSDLLPPYCLLLPCCSLCFAVKKSTSSILVVGAALLIQDLLRMESLPFVTVGLLFISTYALTRSEQDPMSRSRTAVTQRYMPDWFLLPAFLFTSGVLIHFGYQAWQQSVTVSELRAFLLVAIPVFLVALVALRISREFGFRYSTT